MTWPAPTSPPPGVSTATLFRRAAMAETTRLLTVRSTWWSLLAGAGLMLFIGGVAGSSHQGGDPAPIWNAAQTAMVPGQFLFLLVVLFLIAGEYGTGAIRSTLQWTPRRGVVLTARTLVPVTFAAAAAVVVSAMTDLVAWIFLGQAAEVVLGDIARSLGRIALVAGFGASLTVGLGLFLRSTAGTLAAIFLLMLILPITLGNTGVEWLVAISDRLPGRAVVSMLVVHDSALTASSIATVILTWTTAAVIAGGWSLIRRDST